MQALQERADTTARLYGDPHNPHLYYERGLVHEKLGFPDLASADAYRALSLLDSVVDPDGCEFHARRRIQDSPETAESKARESNDDDDDDEDDDDDQFTPLTQSEYDALIHPVYALLVRSLVSCGCFRDAYEFCARGLSSIGSTSDNQTASDREAHATLAAQLATLQREFARRRNLPSSTTEIVIDDPSALPAQGLARRVLYPWNTHEPDRKSPETLALLNEKLRTVAPKCEVRAVALPALHSITTTTKPNPSSSSSSSSSSEQDQEQEQQGEVSIQLGLFAKEDIHPGETILRENSLLTATNRLHDDLCDACNGPLPELSADDPPVACANGCDDTIFCSPACHDQAQQVYHGAVCGLMENLESIGKDIPDPKDKADSLYLLLLGRALAMAATQEMHPLELGEVKFIWGDFVDFDVLDHGAAAAAAAEDGTLPFSFQLNILQPMRLLEEMEIDPYANLRLYDTWVLNTLYAKFRGTASGRLSTWDGGPELCAVHPLWCLANHSCDPNVRWEWGGEITFVARAEAERAVWNLPSGATTSEAEAAPKCRRVGAGIKKDEEILNHYCDIGLGVNDRREWARGALGGFCLCERCRFEAGEM